MGIYQIETDYVEGKLNILQIANGYLDSRLYSALFQALEKHDISNTIYVPVKNNSTIVTGLPKNVIISPCFSSFDRLLFVGKQCKILSDIKKRELLRSIDLVHAHTLFSAGYSARIIKKKHNIPYIVAVRNTDVNLFLKKLFFMRPIGLKILNDANQIIFLSTTYKNYVISHYIPAKYRNEICDKSFVIPNGIDEFFLQNKNMEPRCPSRPIRLMFCGSVDKNKNVHTIVKAMNELRKEGVESKLIIVGNIVDRSMRNTIFSDNRIEYHCFCPKEKVAEYMRDADIFVMPSKHETFGLVYAEAISQGLPVLYTKGQGFDGQFPDGTVGYAVECLNVKDIAEKIKLSIDNYEELSKTCLELCGKFSWSGIASEYKKMYMAIRVSKT